MSRTPAAVVAVGEPGAGRTLLVTRLAAFLSGAPGAAVPAAGGGRPSGDEGGAAGLRCLPAVLRSGRTTWSLALYDPPGLTDRVVPDPEVRRLQALTLARMAAAPVVLHLIDAARLGAGRSPALSAVDRELVVWGQGRPGYAVVATKLDLPLGQTGWQWLRRHLGGLPLVGVSARTGYGFGDLRRLLRDLVRDRPQPAPAPPGRRPGRG